MLIVGTTVVCYNRLTGSRNKKVAGCFRSLTRQEVENLKVNDVVWVHTDRSEIKGYTKVMIVEVGSVAGACHSQRQKPFSYNSPKLCGFTTVASAIQHEKFWRADEVLLWNLIREFSRVSVIGRS